MDWGRMLMNKSSDALRGLKFKELTLTVTSENRTAVQLYDRLGFQTIKSLRQACGRAERAPIHRRHKFKK